MCKIMILFNVLKQGYLRNYYPKHTTCNYNNITREFYDAYNRNSYICYLETVIHYIINNLNLLRTNFTTLIREGINFCDNHNKFQIYEIRIYNFRV